MFSDRDRIKKKNTLQFITTNKQFFNSYKNDDNFIHINDFRSFIMFPYHYVIIIFKKINNDCKTGI